MKFCFRVDASLKIGSGHVIRCLTLADALFQQGHEIFFVCRQHQGNLIEFLRQRKYTVYELSPPTLNMSDVLSEYQQWLGVTELQDAKETLKILSEQSVDWMIVDHYGLSASWQQAIRPQVKYILAIDDLANRQHDADIILDSGLVNSQADYMQLNQRKAEYLLGSHYALLRPEFHIKRLSLEKNPRVYSPCNLRILVNLGGVDKDNVTGTVLDTLSRSAIVQYINVTVVIGVNAPWRDAILQQSENLPFNNTVIINANNMAELMLEHDLAIGAAGSTTWERCCLGLPTIMICIAENQKLHSQKLNDLGVAVSLDQADISTSLLVELEKINSVNLKQMGEKSYQIVDGMGVNRVVETICGNV